MDSLWKKLLSIAFGVGLALALIAGLLTFFPNVVPGFDVTQRDRSLDMYVQYRYSDGDLFYLLEGKIRPPEEDALLAEYYISWDEEGFRVPQMQAESYPIAVFGDSFTEAANAPVPYPDQLATLLDTPVRNYGYRGYGPLEIQNVTEYAGVDEREWVLYGHFSGNDFSDVTRKAERDLVARSPSTFLPWITARAMDNLPEESTAETYDHPMPVIANGQYYDMGFIEDYLWWQRPPKESTFAESESYAVIGETLDMLAAEVVPDTCLGFIFIPTKAQLYYEYIHEDVRQWLRRLGKQPTMRDDGLLELTESIITAESEAAFLMTTDAQRDAMRQLAEERGWVFIDLLPAMQAAADEGQLLYYRYDTHWNQAGHDLAAEVIAEQVSQGCR